MTEPARVDALLILFVSTEGLVSDMMAETFPGHSNHEIMKFPILEGVPEELPLTSGEQGLVGLGGWLKRFLGRQFLRARETESLNISQEGNSTGAGTDWPHMASSDIAQVQY